MVFHVHNEDKGTQCLSSTALRACLAGGDWEGVARALPPLAVRALKSFPPDAMEPPLQQGYYEAAEQEEAAPPPSPLPQQAPPLRRFAFVSLSMLLHDIKAGRVPQGLLESSRVLFVFGSKRFWIFPKTEEQRAESAAQGLGPWGGSKYLDMPSNLREMILEKEAKGEVVFLKPDVLGVPDEEVFGEWGRVSAALVALGEQPLQLQAQWWKTHWRAPFPKNSFGEEGGEHCAWWQDIVENFEVGLHSYGPTSELLAQAGLIPVQSLTPAQLAKLAPLLLPAAGAAAGAPSATAPPATASASGGGAPGALNGGFSEEEALAAAIAASLEEAKPPA